jgi:hypothetical protein
MRFTKFTLIIFCVQAMIILASPIAYATPDPVEMVCTSSMKTMITFRGLIRNGHPKEKTITIATKKNQNMSNVDNEFLSTLYTWAINNSQLEENEFRSRGDMYCRVEYDRLQINNSKILGRHGSSKQKRQSHD